MVDDVVLKRMVGFRNIAVHDYQELDLDVVHAIITKHLADFEAFTRLVLPTASVKICEEW